jgi:hypothetical protein
LRRSAAIVVSRLLAASKAEAEGHQIMLRVPVVVTVVPVVLPRVTVIVLALWTIVERVVEPVCPKVTLAVT